MLGHKSRESLVVVGGLFDNLIVSLVWESLLTKVLEELEMDHCNYNKAIQDKDDTLWQKGNEHRYGVLVLQSGLVPCETT